MAEVLTGDVVGRAGLLTAGFSDDEIRLALRSGELVRLDRGVYALRRRGEVSRLPSEMIRIRGVAQRSPSFVISHASAAVLYRIPLWQIDPNVVHLTKPPSGGAVRRAGRVIHSAALGSAEIRVIDGLAVTSVGRTLVDLARASGFEAAVIAADYALRERLLSPEELAAALDDARYRPGHRAAQRALTFADGRSESPGESRARVLLHRLGLDPPQLQVDVINRDGIHCGRTDLGYIEDAALIEFDGRVKYGKLLRHGQSPNDAVIAEKQREDRLRSVGTSVLRIIWSELNSPALVEQRIVEARRQGRALMASGAFSGSLHPRPAIRIGF